MASANPLPDNLLIAKLEPILGSLMTRIAAMFPRSVLPIHNAGSPDGALVGHQGA